MAFKHLRHTVVDTSKPVEETRASEAVKDGIGISEAS